MLISKNIIILSFSFITKNECICTVKEAPKQLSCTHSSWCTNIRWKLTPFTSKLSRLYNIPNAHANSRVLTSLSLLPKQCMWSRLFLACNPHKYLWSRSQAATYTLNVDTLSSSLQPIKFCRHTSSLPATQCTWSHFFLAWHPRNLCGISAENTCVLSTLGTWLISGIFIPWVRILQLRRLMSNGHQCNIQQSAYPFSSIKCCSLDYCQDILLYFCKTSKINACLTLCRSNPSAVRANELDFGQAEIVLEVWTHCYVHFSAIPVGKGHRNYPQVTLTAGISLTFSLHPSLLFIAPVRSSKLSHLSRQNWYK